ncbi:hypothetical protein CRG98_001675 [Punica granatum]|uniref:Glycosyltransferase n=1 Tax=Punica granatum TaxID=22663 RepID=A0A2I0LBL8_PUNGR|nr:hypothetical protein CRG98_001675 [Punica granatum]
MEEQGKRSHVVVLTYPAQGHINPLLQFTKRLAAKGLRATFATTPYTILSIRSTTIGLEPISDGFDEGGFSLAPSTEAYLESFKTAGSKTLSDLVQKFIHTEDPVTCIVYDSLLPWAMDVARKFGIYSALLLTVSASVSSLFWHIHRGQLSFPVKLEEDDQPLTVPGIPPIRHGELPTFLARPEDQSAYLSVIMGMYATLDQHDFVFCNSSEELEIESVKAMSGQWPLVMVGPLIPLAYSSSHQSEEDTAYGANLWDPSNEPYLQWLDQREPNSVIYVSFGSMAKIPQAQVEEFASGLKLTNKPFLWVLKDYPKDKLPVGCLGSGGETFRRGLVVEWCNQLEVLAHRAVGCFFTHCGWNSTLEGISLGVPMVGAPIWSDQPMNAKFVDEVLGLGVRAKRDEAGILTAREIERCVHEVMDGERSDEFRANASNWAERAKGSVSKGGSSDRNIEEFIAKLVKRGRKID